MQLTIKSKKSLKISIILIAVLLCFINSTKLAMPDLNTNISQAQAGTASQRDTPDRDGRYKMLYYYPSKKGVPDDDPLKTFNYKFVNLDEDEMVVYDAKSPGQKDMDKKESTDKYLITMKYQDIFRPCLLNRLVCLVGEFISEFSSNYNFDYTVPKEVLNRMGGQDEVYKNCILVMLNPIKGIEDSQWFCSEDEEALISFRNKMTQYIKQSADKLYDFAANHYLDGIKSPGVVYVDSKQLSFKEGTSYGHLTDKFSFEWTEAAPYAYALFKKETMKWKPEWNSKDRPISDTCLKVIKRTMDDREEEHYFCISYTRTDVDQKLKLTQAEDTFLAEMYASKVNERLQQVAIVNALKMITKDPTQLDIDSNTLFPIKTGIRSEYLMYRHAQSDAYRLGLIPKEKLDENLLKEKRQIIDRTCANYQVCINAVKYCIDHKTLPMAGTRERWAMDMQNPYHRTMPKDNIKISLPLPGGQGEKIVNAAASILDSKNYFAEKNNNKDNSLTRDNIVKAFNTIKNTREANKLYNTKEEFNASCNSKAPDQVSLRRKLSLLNYGSDIDIFFIFLPVIRQTLVEYSKYQH